MSAGQSHPGSMAGVRLDQARQAALRAASPPNPPHCMERAVVPLHLVEGDRAQREGVDAAPTAGGPAQRLECDCPATSGGAA